MTVTYDKGRMSHSSRPRKTTWARYHGLDEDTAKTVVAGVADQRIGIHYLFLQNNDEVNRTVRIPYAVTGVFVAHLLALTGTYLMNFVGSEYLLAPGVDLDIYIDAEAGGDTGEIECVVGYGMY